MPNSVSRAGSPFQASSSGGAGGVSLASGKGAVTGQVLTVEYVSGSGDAAALVTVESPSGTILWRKRFTAAYTFSEAFPRGIVGAVGQDIFLKVSASTANVEATMTGYANS